MKKGIIIKGIGGFYYVKTGEDIFECRARGLFRKKQISPQVGDYVEIRENLVDMTGYVERIFDRQTYLYRPPVANVNQAVIVMAIKNPDPDLWLLDRFLLLAQHQNLDIVICINKIDLEEEKIININDIYKKCSYPVINISAKLGLGINELKEKLHDKISVFAGPSGVGKTTILNKIQPNLKLKTGEISKKTNRGKHTTRHVELLELNDGGWVVDTPGFSSLDINFAKEEELERYFNEIYEISHLCKFAGCKHYREPGCAVKQALEEGKISRSRYDNYLNFLQEIKNNRRY